MLKLSYVALFLAAIGFSTQVSAAPPNAPTIGWPKDGRVFAKRAQTIGGKCVTGNSVHLSGNIQGGPLQSTCSGGRYTFEYNLAGSSGAKTLRVTQANVDGASPAQSISVSLELPVGKPSITSPAAQAQIRNASQTVAGACVTGAQVRIYGDIVNAPQVVACANSRYSITVQVTAAQGQKKIRATQSTSSSTSAESSRIVHLDTVAPSAPTVSSPANGATLNNQNVTISGSCELLSVVQISGAVVGSPVSINCSASGDFSRASQVTAGNGTKALALTQVDRAGNVSVARNVSVTLGGGTGTPGLEPRNSNRIFLSGHSLVDYPLIDYVAAVTSSTRDSFNFNQQLIGGSPIRVRTLGDWGASGYPGYSRGENRSGSGMNVVSELKNPRTIGAGEKYDTLVITENHSLIPAIQYENTAQFLRQYHDVAIAGNAATRTFFYHSWLDINKNDPTGWINHEKKTQVAWECISSKVNQSLQASNRTDRIRSLPAGGALVNLVERAMNNEIPEISGSTLQRMNMIFRDNVHYTNLGGYYMSLVVYSAVYGKSPLGSAPPADLGISMDFARRLQTIAWNFVSAYYADSSNSDSRSMASCRDFFVNTYCASYYNHKGEPGAITACRNFHGQANDAGNPLRDAAFSPLPVP